MRIRRQTFRAAARIVTDEEEEMTARNLLADKYSERNANGTLSKWARTALTVALDISPS